jgi:hypothetical protein
MLLPFKFTTDLRVLIPSPLHDSNIIDLYERIIPTFLGHTRQVIAHVARSRMDMALLPAGMLTLSLLPYHANATVARMHDDHSYTDSPEAQYYRQSLVAAHPVAPLLIGCLDRCLPHSAWKRDDQWHRASTQSAFGDLPPLLVDELLSWIQSEHMVSSE